MFGFVVDSHARVLRSARANVNIHIYKYAGLYIYVFTQASVLRSNIVSLLLVFVVVVDVDFTAEG